jgi:hypothetical protein
MVRRFQRGDDGANRPAERRFDNISETIDANSRQRGLDPTR